jgi:hypothetical protein
MDNVDNRVQLAVRQAYVPALKGPDGVVITEGKFETTVLKCRDNKALEGETLEGVDWQTLCTMAVPGVDWSK